MPVKLLDGGFYNQLGKLVNEELDNHPLWGCRFLKYNPEACIQAHRDTIKAGVDVVTTVTYQASVTGFQKYLNLSEEDSYNLIKESVDLVRKAIELEYPKEKQGEKKKLQIAGSAGPYGAWLHDGSEYRGEYVDNVSAEVIREWHRPRIEALVEAGVEIVRFDTIPALAEAEILLNLIKEFPSVKTWVCFSCKDDKHISHGEKFSTAAKRCWEVNSDQLLAVGINCLHPTLVVPLLKSAKEEAPHVPLMCFSNTEERYDLQLKKWVGKEQCQPLVNYLDSFLDIGLEYVGGCCRTGIQEIQEFSKHIEARRKLKNDV